jgi:hypothetical protein
MNIPKISGVFWKRSNWLRLKDGKVLGAGLCDLFKMDTKSLP